MATKISYVSVINDVINGVELDDERIEKLKALKASLEKRASRKSEGPTKAQKANAELGERIAAAMVEGTVYSTEDIKGLIPELANATPQKVTPLMKHLSDAGRVTITKVKGKNSYSLA
jgi:hypothetical protein